MENFEKISNFIKKLSLNLSMISLSVMSLLITLEVVLRIFNYSTLISDEYGGYLMVIIVYLGAIASFSGGKFVRVTAFRDKFPKKLNIFLDLLFRVILIGYLSFLGRFVWEMNWNSLKFDTRSFSVMRTPLYIPQFFMSLGLFFFILFTISDLFIRIKKREEEE